MRMIDADALLERIENPYQYREVARWVNDMPTIEPKKGKLVAIKDIDMPPCCGDCPCFHESSAYTCGATGELLPDAWAWKCRSVACPLEEKEFVIEFNAPDVAEEDLKKAELKAYKTMVEKIKEFRKMSEYIIEAKEGCFGTGTLQGELVRCGDCKYFDDRPGWQSCQAFGKWFGETEMGVNDYCSRGEKA